MNVGRLRQLAVVQANLELNEVLLQIGTAASDVRAERNTQHAASRGDSTSFRRLQDTASHMEATGVNRSFIGATMMRRLKGSSIWLASMYGLPAS